MILTEEQLNDILVKSNNSNDDILEKIKVELQGQFKVVYEEWTQKSFDINHLFNISWTIKNQQFYRNLHYCI